MGTLNLEPEDSENDAVGRSEDGDNSSDEEIRRVRAKSQIRPRLMSSDEESNSNINDSVTEKENSPHKNETQSENIEDRLQEKELKEGSNEEEGGLQFDSSGDERSNGSIAVEKSHKSKKSRPKKKVDPKFEITKETQRLEREKNLSLPYHRPKQRTLSEFLSQRKSHALKTGALRSTSANMIHVWRKIEESTKEAVDFFKSESEEEQDDANACDSFLLRNCEAEKENRPIGEEEIPVAMCPMESGTLHTIADAAEGKIVNGNQNENINSSSDDPKMKPLTETSVVAVDSVTASEKTSLWLENLVALERKNDRISKSQIDPKILDKVPEISMDDDFETDFSPVSKAQNTHSSFERGQIKFKTTTMTRTDTGELLSVGTEVITLSAANECKPGYKFQQLKETLREQIESKWEEQMKQKMSQAAEKEKDDFEDEAEFEECEDDASEATEESEPEENDMPMSEKPRKSCQFGDSEAEESDNDADDEHIDDDEDDSDSEAEAGTETETEVASHQISEEAPAEDIDCSLLPAFQPGGGLLMGGSALTQLTQPLPFSPVSSPAVSSAMTPRTPHSTLPKSTLATPRVNPHSSQTPHGSGPKKNLFGSEAASADGPMDENDLQDDPFMFVSGAFPEPTANNLTPTLKKSRRIIIEEDSDDGESGPAAEVVEENESNTREGVAPSQDQTIKSDVSDDEDDDSMKAGRKKKIKHLTFSDDEDDDNPAAPDASGDEDEAIDDVASVATTKNDKIEEEDVAYDSEENEVRAPKPGDFFDQEAELSESEWSGDEDERGLDKLEAEAGDADVLDQDQVASQLGRIHMRRLLDDDARDVRLLQEMLFEDGDLHDGETRDRKFRWKNLSGFEAVDRNGEQDGSDGDEEESAEMAKSRHEKAKFLLQLEKDGKDGVTTEDIILKDTRLPISIGLSKTTALAPKPGFIRGSFLSKDRGFLSRISKATAGAESEGQLGPAHSRNFVFAVQDKEDKDSGEIDNDNRKRKAATKCAEAVKRSKIAVVTSRSSFLDQLE